MNKISLITVFNNQSMVDEMINSAVSFRRE